MHCSRCNEKVRKGARFCDRCGAPVSGGDGEAGGDSAPGGSSVDDLVSIADVAPPAPALSAPDESDAQQSISDAASLAEFVGDEAGAPPGGVGLSVAFGAVEALASRYEVEGLLGRGGMGQVFRARDRRLGRYVAVKRLGPELEGDRRGLERFLAEARAIAQLSHPNIVTIYELGRDADGPFIVMELVEGQDLGALLEEKGALSPKEALPLLRGVGKALAHAHRKGIVHRDVKPQNVLVSEDGVPKVVDFGLARLSSVDELTKTGYGLGTLAYMAPEQRRDAKRVDHRADIYAFGKTIYHVLTGDVPDVVDLEQVPPAMRDVLRKALQGRPERRYFAIQPRFHEGAFTTSEFPPTDARCRERRLRMAEHLSFQPGELAGWVSKNGTQVSAWRDRARE